MPGKFDATEMPRLDAFDEEFGQDPCRYSTRTTTQDESAVLDILQRRAGCGRHRRTRLGLVGRRWAAAAGAAIRGHTADIAANPRRFGRGNRSPPSPGGGAEERDHGAQGRAGAGGSHHRSPKGRPAGIPRRGTICVLVLKPGCAEVRNREPTGAERRRTASPTAANRPSCIAEG
jgi:hypothetical protein